MQRWAEGRAWGSLHALQLRVAARVPRTSGEPLDLLATPLAHPAPLRDRRPGRSQDQGTAQERRLALADSMPSEDRLRLFVHFFERHPGFPLQLPMGHGFGHGAIDFLSWEISSGRLCPRRGSAWWRAVNGLMALDLVACEWALARGLDDQDPVTEAWLRYVVRADDLAARLRPGYLRETQSLFWEAHQRSLHRALEQAAHLFAKESILEQRFIDEVVLPNVDQAALGNEASCLDTIALFTFALYPINPGHYGASKADLQLGRTLTIDRIPLSRCYGRRHQDIGRRSVRWSGHSKPLRSPRQARKRARARSSQPPQTDGLTGVRPALT